VSASDPSTFDDTRRPVGRHYGGGLEHDLVETALGFIETGSADRLSLRAVARRVGVSRAAPVHYFGNKRGLFTTIAVGGFTLLTDRVLNATPFGTAHEVDDIQTVATLYSAFAAEHPARFEVMHRRTLFDPGDPTLLAAEARLFLALELLVAVSRRGGRQGNEQNKGDEGDDQEVRRRATAAWSLAQGYCALRLHGTLDRQFTSTAPPTSSS
jgi:AcrR family transcriptional regulator